jgi:hypothetical protein
MLGCVRDDWVVWMLNKESTSLLERQYIQLVFMKELDQKESGRSVLQNYFMNT